MRIKKVLFYSAMWLIVLLSRPLIFAQTTTGTILGTVRDATGAVIPGVTITITSVTTGLSRTEITDNAGNYSVPRLLPGDYTITAELQGFKKAVITGVKLQVAQEARYDITLEIGELTEEVTVTATGPALLQTDDPTLGQAVDERKIAELPLNGRNFLQLITIGTGAAPIRTGQGGFTEAASGRPNMSYTISGQREVSISYLMDGVEAKSEWLQSSSIQPSVDAIQEFKVHRNLFSAEFGSATAVINVAIKQGTNEFHGTFFEFLRNDRFDSSQLQDPVRDGRKVKPPFRLNQFGGTFGGPIIKGRTFFFLNYEGLRTRRLITFQALAIPSRFRGGNFSDLRDAQGNLIPIFDPATFDPTTRTRQPFPGNIIPPNRLDPVAQRLLQFFPLPTNEQAPRGTINLVTANPLRRDFNQFNIRVDHKISDKDNLYSRYSFVDSPLVRPGLTRLSATVIPLAGQNVAVNETHVFTPRLINEFRFGYNRDIIGNLPPPTGGIDIGGEILGLKNLTRNARQFGLPTTSGLTFSGIGSVPFSVFSLGNLFQVSDILTIIKGKHSVKAGLDVRRMDPWQITVDSVGDRGSFFFSGIFTAQLDPRTGAPVGGTGEAMADLLLGIPEVMNGATGSTLTHFTRTDWNIFLQDDIKVTPNFTLNLGMRWEFHQQPKAEDNRIAIFDPGLGRMLLADVEPELVRRQLVDPDFNNFSPRLGFAYNMFGRSKTVLRGGVGIYYDNTAGNEEQFKTISHPKFQSRAFVNENPRPQFFMRDLFPPPEPGRVSRTPFTQERRDRWPYVLQWNLSLQHNLHPNLLLEIDYVGSHGNKLSKRWNVNQAVLDADPNNPTPVKARQPYPFFDAILGTFKAGISNYNAMQIRVEKSFSKGFTILAGYTFSRSLDMDSSASFAADNQDIRNRRGDYGLSGFHAKNRFNVSYIWELPFGKGKRYLSGVTGALGKFIEGWQINGITQLQSGSPFTVSVPGDHARTGAFPFVRANRICDGNLPAKEQTIFRFFDTGCFVAPPIGRFGNNGRNTIIGPGFKTFDFSIFKNTYITEDKYIQFRTEFFNLFNHSNYAQPVGSVGSPLFGRILSEGPAREIQFGLRFVF